MHLHDQSIPFHIPLNINKWTHVFFQDDSVRGSLVSPYKEPLCVLSHTLKTFSLHINGRAETVSVNTLKKAYSEVSMPLDGNLATPTFDPLQPPTPSPTSVLLPQLSTNKPYVARADRTVHWPNNSPKLFISDNLFCVSSAFLCYWIISILCHWTFCQILCIQFIFLVIIFLFNLLHFCTISCLWLVIIFAPFLRLLQLFCIFTLVFSG